MPRNIIDKLAWWIPNKEKRKQFRYDINKTVIDSLINNKEEFKSKYSNLYYKINKDIIDYFVDSQEELKIKYPDLYNQLKENITKKLMNMPKKELVEEYTELFNYIKYFKTANSEIVNKYLNGLKGIEIGGAAYADYGIDAVKIDRIDISKNDNNYYKMEQKKYNGFIQDVDIIADGDDLPFKDNTVDFVFTSHVLEHFFDPIKALKEWYRVTKTGGYIFMIVPHKERTFDKDRERTTLQELIDRHNGVIKSENQNTDMHHSVWITEDIIELCKYLNYNVVEYHNMDDCRTDGFIIVIQK